MTRRDEIFEIICDYCVEHKGNSPSENNLLKTVRARGYKISRSTLRTHVLKLRAEGRLERLDGDMIVPNSEWIRPDAEYLPIAM